MKRKYYSHVISLFSTFLDLSASLNFGIQKWTECEIAAAQIVETEIAFNIFACLLSDFKLLILYSLFIFIFTYIFIIFIFLM